MSNSRSRNSRHQLLLRVISSCASFQVSPRLLGHATWRHRNALVRHTSERRQTAHTLISASHILVFPTKASRSIHTLTSASQSLSFASWTRRTQMNCFTKNLNTETRGWGKSVKPRMRIENKQRDLPLVYPAAWTNRKDSAGSSHHLWRPHRILISTEV